ncbi:EF-hand domain-containing protein [Thalassoglobus polymorphus]|uniref:EF hand n=1 Tax=Thalassoglobus polymorphus TaxID=2527994 RepID=A0A517QV44_9PLAN|nr:EF-hand domain-containing protein [Thalassoglobus polymorphus]QDT35457.1 EF hand [Thalassoglobus polymorphus]
MSDESNSPSVATTEAKPKRNPVERVAVWGLIGIMVLFVCTEGIARFGYSMTLPRLQKRINEDDGVDPRPLTVEEADTLVFGFPTKTVEGQKVTYRWKGLLKDFGAIHLPYDEDNIVLTLVTDAPPEIEEKVAATGEDEEESGPDPSIEGAPVGDAAPGGDGDGETGRQRGGRDFDPMELDADGDGKLSKEEAPERMQQIFDRIDTNGDGFADAEEFAAMRAARKNRGSESPAAEGSSPEKTKKESEAAEKKAEPKDATTKPAEEAAAESE